MSLSPNSPAGPVSGSWLLRGRSSVWLIGLSAICGVGLAAAGVMLMRAADGAGVKDVVAELSRPATTGRSAAPPSVIVAPPARTTDAAVPPPQAGAAPPPVVAEAPTGHPATAASEAAAPLLRPEPSQTAAINPAAVQPKSPAEQPVVASPSPPPADRVASVPAKPTVPASVANAPSAPVAPTGHVVKREALSPVKPQQARTRAAAARPLADPQASSGREAPIRRAASTSPAATSSAPAGLRSIAAPAGSAPNVRAYTVASEPPGNAGGSGNVRIVRVEVPGSR